MGYNVEGMTMTAKAGWWILKAVWFLAASFAFSWIFWSTKKWVETKPKKRK